MSVSVPGLLIRLVDRNQSGAQAKSVHYIPWHYLQKWVVDLDPTDQETLEGTVAIGPYDIDRIWFGDYAETSDALGTNNGQHFTLTVEDQPYNVNMPDGE